MPAFSTSLEDISINNKDKFISNYGDIQPDMAGLIQSDNFIDNALIIGKNKEFFALSKYGLNHDVSNYFGWNLKHVNGTSLLPIRQSPLSYAKDVIPIILPISQFNIVGFF